MEKTDLKKILSVSGQRGLFLYLSQARNGVIVESLETKQRTTFGESAKVSSLADISVYTTSEDVSLKVIFTDMAKKLNNGPAMSSKSDPQKDQKPSSERFFLNMTRIASMFHTHEEDT